MIILKRIETNILEGTLWLAQLQIPRFPFKSTKVMGTTGIGMDRQCNWKGQFENWSWGIWHYHPESPVKSLLQIPRPGFLELSYTCQKIQTSMYLGDRIQKDLLGLGHSTSLRQLMLRQWMGEDVT